MADDIRLDDFRHTYRMPVRWSDMDALGHVNNTNFFTYDESVRLDYFTQLMRDDPRFWHDYGLILAHIEADFLAQVEAPAELMLGFRIAKLGRSSMHAIAGMFLGDKLVAVTRSVIVWFDYPNGRPLPLPESVRAKIVAYEKRRPE
jgi:acyl-CoA thioester hydrolase